MKIYHTETQEDYNALMIELDKEGYIWCNSKKASSENYYLRYKNETTVTAYDYKVLEYADLAYEKKYNPEIEIIEYKAKGENMTQQEEMKQKLHENALDIAVAIGVFTRGTSTVEADLQEAKSSAKKLIENIDEYLESRKPKPEFKVGDYVVDDGSYLTMKVDEVSNSVVCSTICYNFRYFTVRDNFVCEIEYLRHATPEEIAEYEAALTFHKHGRKPFEVKKGDLIKSQGGKNHLICNPENLTKTEFLNWGWEFLKTAEEVNKWLENK